MRDTDKRKSYWNEFRKTAHYKEYYATYRMENKERIAAKQTAWYKKNKERVLARQGGNYKALRMRFYDMYGVKKEGHKHGVCTCCGADLTAFGTLSHIDGSGAQHRAIIKGGFDKILKEAVAVKDTSRFAAECFNCNLAAVRNGGICPHKTKTLNAQGDALDHTYCRIFL